MEYVHSSPLFVPILNPMNPVYTEYSVFRIFIAAQWVLSHVCSGFPNALPHVFQLRYYDLPSPLLFMPDTPTISSLILIIVIIFSEEYKW
jgi:hypothetical protein